MDDKQELLQLMSIALEDWFGPAHANLGQRWRGGTLVLKPENPALQAKEIPIEALFHKVVMLRESLRVLEQRLNNHPKLDDEDRVQLQQYITRVYGTLTTFNVLFRDDEDKFVGQKG
jgi:hypothetical protein